MVNHNPALANIFFSDTNADARSVCGSRPFCVDTPDKNDGSTRDAVLSAEPNLQRLSMSNVYSMTCVVKRCTPVPFPKEYDEERLCVSDIC